MIYPFFPSQTYHIHPGREVCFQSISGVCGIGGIGDDEYSCGVDGLHGACLKNGPVGSWNVSWPKGSLERVHFDCEAWIERATLAQGGVELILERSMTGLWLGIGLEGYHWITVASQCGFSGSRTGCMDDWQKMVISCRFMREEWDFGIQWDFTDLTILIYWVASLPPFASNTPQSHHGFSWEIKAWKQMFWTTEWGCFIYIYIYIHTTYEGGWDYNFIGICMY